MHDSIKRIHYAPGSRCVILSTDRWVYKIPWNPAVRRCLILEYRRNRSACLDPFWSSYVVPLEFIGPVARSKRLNCVAGPGDEVTLRLLERHCATFSEAEVGPAEQIAPCPYIESMVFPQLSVAAQANFRRYRDSTRIPAAPAHGDFHRGNLFAEDGHIRVIDWTGYRPVFWRDYDPFHLLFCNLLEREGGRWTELAIRLRDVYNGLAGKTLGSCWSEIDLINYLVCRCELELAQDILLKRLRPGRLEKYRSVVQEFFDRW